MCKNRDAVFNELALVFKNSEYYTRAMSPGFVSSMACFQLVEKLRGEIRKPFDKDWSESLTEKVEKLADPCDVTNCALFAGRIFYTLAPVADRQDIAIKGTIRVFQELEYSEDVVKPFMAAITK